MFYSQPPLDDHGFEKYDWDRDDQSYILAAYFWGYTAVILFAGTLSEWAGPVNVVIYSNILGTIFTGLHHVAAMGGLGGMIAIRVLVGVVGVGILTL